MDRKQKLKLMAEHYRRSDAAFKRWVDSGYSHNAKPVSEPMPEWMADMRCEATTRAGTPCKRKDIYRNGRCKYHGGMSTGTQTPEGKARQLEGYRRWQETRRQATSTGMQRKEVKNGY